MFAGLPQFLAAYEQITGPVLARCSNTEVCSIVGRLTQQSDFCLHDEPATATIERVTRLTRDRGQTDALTGLANRSMLLKHLERATQAGSGPHSLLLVDIDHFKEVNDQQGHTQGDQILVVLAQRIKDAAPANALLARHSGEVFAISAPCNEQQALMLGDQCLKAVSDEAILEVKITVSVGIATSDNAEDGTRAAEQLLHQADEAIYAAKARGRNQANHFSHLQHEAQTNGRDFALESFQNRTRVVSERAASMIATRGRQMFDDLRVQADRDELTGLYNRRYFNRRLRFDIETPDRRGKNIAVALLDIDHFGLVNKTHGWTTGDRVLVEIADRVATHVRDGDWVARYGGEELAVIMYDVTLDAAKEAMERLRVTIETEPFDTGNNQSVSMTISVGTAVTSANDSDLDVLIERASSALLDAKRSGRNRVCTSG